jgi:predicted dehydrogenase
MPKIHFAVVGCGHIGKRHADMILRNPDATLAALCDSKGKNTLGLDSYNVPFFNHIDHLLNSGLPIDVVNICTPNGLHTKHALAALHNNRHVLIEKPMGLTAEHCSWVIQKAKEKNKKVFCVMQNRYSPPAAILKKIVSENILGRIYFVQINCFWNRDETYYTGRNWHGRLQNDGGTLFTQFSHFIDLMYWLFGDIKDISAKFFDFNHQHLTEFEDSGNINFNFINGGSGCFHYSTSAYGKNLESSITILAEKGTIKAGGQYMEKIEYCYIKDYTLPALPETNAANDYGLYKGSAANHHFIIENVIQCLHNNAAISTTAEEGRKVVEIIERIYAHRPASLLKHLP